MALPFVVLRIPVGVNDFLYLVDDTRGNQRIVERADSWIVTHHIRDIAVGFLDHHIDRLHDTVFHGVVFQVEIDVGQSFKIDHGIAVVVKT